MEKPDQPQPWYVAAAKTQEEKAANPTPSPYLDRVKIQAEVLVPVLRAFREELGEDRANRIAWHALADWRACALQEILSTPSGPPVERFRASTVAMTDIIGDAVDVEMIKDNSGAIEFNVVGCRFAQFFSELGEPELGFVLACAWDDTSAEKIGAGEVELTRTGTIMRGAGHCDFRHSLRHSSE
jgi:hypothetical protein